MTILTLSLFSWLLIVNYVQNNTIMPRKTTYDYRLELNGKPVESGCTATMETIRSAALYNAKELHHHEIKVYAGPNGKLEYLGTCHPDGSYFDAFNKRHRINEKGKWVYD